MLVGLPGSGKTYLAEQLARKLNMAFVSNDRIRSELFEKPNYTPEEEGVVKHMMFMMTEEYLRAGLPVVYDGSANKVKERLELRTLARKVKADPVVIWQQVDPEACFSRLQKRAKEAGHEAPNKKAFVEAAKTMQTPVNEKPIVVSGKHVFAGQFQSVLRSLFEARLIADDKLRAKIPVPGLVNLVTSKSRGVIEVDHKRDQTL